MPEEQSPRALRSPDRGPQGRLHAHRLLAHQDDHPLRLQPALIAATFFSSPARRGRGTMRSMVEGASAPRLAHRAEEAQRRPPPPPFGRSPSPAARGRMKDFHFKSITSSATEVDYAALGKSGTLPHFLKIVMAGLVPATHVFHGRDAESRHDAGRSGMQAA